MPLHRAVPLAFLLSALAGFAAHRAIPYAHACLAPLDTGATYDLARYRVSLANGGTITAAEVETASWPETATLSLPDKRMDFGDGSHLVYR